MTTSLTTAELRELVKSPGPEDDKYSRGVVGLVVGSEQYPGAALLSTEAALHSGVGMVRLMTTDTPRALVLANRPEVVVTPGRVDAVVVGCGIGEGEDLSARLADLPIEQGTPVVVDAGALAQAPQIGGMRVLTPHKNELQRLCATLGVSGQTAAEKACTLASMWNVVVYLKGHESLVCTPKGVAYSLEPATAWLATAGTGDVLAGLMGALFAQQKKTGWTLDELAQVAAAAGQIHAMAAARLSIESGEGQPGPILSAELARALSPVIAELAT
jgi:hydroxyethylthiazole kinase-like uncharacterized protein yjeF